MKSNLQIISGKYRGKKLFLPNDARPTQNLARGALFNMLLPIINTNEQICVWDVFAGSGAFGLECLSRYDNIKVVFTDNNPNSIDTVKRNLSAIDADSKATVEKNDAISVINKYGPISNLIFIDPPYADFGLGLLFVKKLTKIAQSGTVLVWEFESTQKSPNIDDSWDVLKDKTYGRARFFVLIKK